MKKIVFFLFFLFASTSSASEYEWLLYNPNGFSGGVAASPSAACSMLSSMSGKPHSPVATSDPLRFNCSDSTWWAYRRGTTCPSGKVYSASTGDCLCPAGTFDQGGQCLVFGDAGQNCGSVVIGGLTFPKIYNSSGQCVSWLDSDLSSQCKNLSTQTKTQTVWVPFGADGKPGKPEVEAFGCEASVIDTTHCELPAPRTNDSGVYLPPNGKKCKVGLSFSGNVAGSSPPGSVPVGNPATGSAGLCPEGVDCTPKPLPIENEKTPCKYEWDASIGMQTCRSSTYKGQPGNLKCGTGPNGFQCFEAKPNSEKMVIDTKVKEEAQGDGTTKITKTDTATKVICTGENSCTTINATNTGVTIKDGAGNVVSSTGQCTGALCATSPGGKGDSDGDGLKDEDGDGDPGPLGAPGFEETPDIGESTQAFMSRLKRSPIATSISGIRLNGSGSCTMSSAQTQIGTISADSFCNNSHWLDPLYYIFLAIHALAAVRVFLSA